MSRTGDGNPSGDRRSPWASQSDEKSPTPRQARIGINGDAAVLERFQKLCRDDRRTYVEMLRILIDAFEKDSETDDRS